ncbi:4'-phosphopantetheinyl transferase family protein [Actinomycetospora straminea]|uniref:4'-phosphopantetheinyl transferase superfamily protein n=1 Tax=Actinomycetospora straminea TaxID=663607 RepID=A0ABP9EPY6_9PSEU|nr:4'-phosphopantetheinyl transferase superfamily protein [Actinomycetospora straminea]MDD7933412.1 4'-phosphopantetheinyl transferase superfamily protein [Actinomycetospora straminea]
MTAPTDALADLLPGSVVAVARADDDPSAVLAPEEEAAVARAVATRRAEFTTARTCARDALSRLGAPAAAIPVGEKRAPIWPEGVVGAITHCAGFRGAAVAWRDEVRSVGLDAEPHVALPDGVLEAVSDERERAVLAALARDVPDVRWDKLLFSAKESVYKAWFPLTGRWLGFEEAELVPSADGTFRAGLRVPGPVVDGREVTGFAGRWVVRDGLVITAIALPAGSP